MADNDALSIDLSSAQNEEEASLIDVFSFYVGSTLYATRIENVLSLSQGNQAVRPMPGYPDTVLGVVDYHGDAVPLFDLASLLETDVDYIRWEELVHTLSQRKQDHIDWMDALEHSIRSGEAFTKTEDPHKCAFGQWYDNFETDNDELRGLLVQFDEPHKKIHKLAESLLKLSAENKHNLALDMLSHERDTTLSTLVALFHRTETLLTVLARTVILYTTIDGKSPVFALKISEVDTAQSYTQDQFSEEKYGIGAQENQIVAGFLSDDEGAICILLDMNTLKNVVEDTTSVTTII